MAKTEGIGSQRSRGWTQRPHASIGGWTGAERVAGGAAWADTAGPFAKVWGEIQELLEVNAGLEAKTVFEYLQRRDPGQFADGQLRTLQRRVKSWRATEGLGREVFFAQQHPPGRLGASDFTHMDELGVTLQGQSFPHLIYHFVLTYSNWEAGTLCYSESFESLFGSPDSRCNFAMRLCRRRSHSRSANSSRYCS